MPSKGRTVVLATAASVGYFDPLISWLGSIAPWRHRYDTVAVYDLGLADSQRTFLARIPWVTRVAVEPFCPHWRKCYTWKPWVLSDAGRYGTDVIYMDAGTVVLRTLEPVERLIEKQGFFCVEVSPGEATVAEGVPEDMARDVGFDYERFKHADLAAGGFIGYRVGTPGAEVVSRVLGHARAGLTLGWSEAERHRDAGVDECGIVRNCPLFRHDQSWFSVELYRVFGGRLLPSSWEVFLNFVGPDELPNQIVWLGRRKSPTFGMGEQLVRELFVPWIPRFPRWWTLAGRRMGNVLLRRRRATESLDRTWT